jgi:arylformamidase
MLYRDFATVEDIDAEYNLQPHVPESADITDRWTRESAVARDALDCALGMRYGPTTDEYVDIFPATGVDDAPAPVHVFIHGGYWRRFTAREFSFAAPKLVETGTTVVVVNYSLCPKVSIDEIVRQARSALAWTHDHIADHGGDPARITVSGHSAGGHLTAMLMATDWTGDYGRPLDIIKGACPISGIYDLAPMPYTFIQPSVQLNGDSIRRLSPIGFIPAAAPKISIAVGGAETNEFVRQSRDYHEAWCTGGLDADLLVIENRHHFDILDGFQDTESALFHTIMSLTNR